MLVPHGSHIMVVDGSRLVLFRNMGNDYDPKLELIEQERDIAPRTSELGAGEPGRGFQSLGGRRAAYQQADLHQIMEDQFAEHACAKLEAVLADHKTEAILIAPPRVLGKMRKQLKPQFRQRVVAEIGKDYAGRSPEDVAKLLGNLEP